jgi:putative transposase
MHNESNIRRDKHCVFKLNMHWVFVSNSRRRVFDARTIDVLRGIFFADVCSDAQTTLVAMDGEDGHMHLPISIVGQHIEQQRAPD